MTSDKTAVEAGLRRFGDEGRPASEAARWVMAEMGDDFPVFQLMTRFFSVFQVSVRALRELENWEGLGTGGPLTDADLDAIIGPLTVRETPLS
ncbi:hypothetical protein JHN63_09870 [Streptomyces sp. MBT65]|uniref:hypothetical protein n=1 Tax=Streptomyces sp. MBT65 TaxID=1488395 RepID=UPI00190D548A|nr:hypothetical protein [Streptomyces sp. MBT65]MBK3574123.1 hypothetical protein [Streptomyces sp. MBT65]